MTEFIDTTLPPCPCCKLPAKRFISVLTQVSYQCDNDQCEQFPATSYFEKEPDARAEWLLIAQSSKPEN